MTKLEFLNLGKQPITNNFLKIQNPKNEFFYNLRIVFDDKTKLVSSAEFIPPEKMFNDTYAHRASMSITMQKAYKDLSIKIKERFNPKSVLEIGSNDGIFLKNFNEANAIGVEPCKNLADITNSMNIKTFDEYWTMALSKKIINQFGTFNLVYSANTISHIHDLNETFLAISEVLADKGVFILEDPSLLEVIRNTSYDQFYDEHAYVFSITAINNLVKKTDLEIFDVELLDTHGGSNRIYIKKKKNNIKISKNISKILHEEKENGINHFETYIKFANNVKKSKYELVEIFKTLKKSNKKIIGYGATYKSSTILNYCGLNNYFIDYFVDTTKNKQGKFTPGTHIPIIKPNDNIDDDINYAYLGAWNFKKEIFSKEKKYINRGGKFITHVPSPQIL
jgi:methylation protein EvaC